MKNLLLKNEKLQNYKNNQRKVCGAYTNIYSVHRHIYPHIWLLICELLPFSRCSCFCTYYGINTKREGENFSFPPSQHRIVPLMSYITDSNGTYLHNKSSKSTLILLFTFIYIIIILEKHAFVLFSSFPIQMVWHLF